MTTPPTLPDGEGKEPRDAAYWAQLTSLLQVSRVPTGALNLNVEGRQAVGPLQGFGQMWKKTFTLRLPEISMTPAEVMQLWKANFIRFQPRQNRFFSVMKAIVPGDIVLINASMTGMPISTGVIVLYADDESFTLMTTQGHPESGWVTFSVSTEEDGLVCQVQTIARTNDPLYEIGFRTFASHTQDHVWTHVLESLAAHLQVPGQVQFDKTCVDPRVQWSEAKNIWHNAAVRTMIYTIGAPLRWLRRGRARRQK